MTRTSHRRLYGCILPLLAFLGLPYGLSHSLASRRRERVTAFGMIGSKRRKLDNATFLDKKNRFHKVIEIRGGDVASKISDVNEYIGASKLRSWAVLAFSILVDTCSVTLMKTAQEESSMSKLVISFMGLFISLAGFALALKSIDVGVAYAVWAATGTFIVSIAGVLFFGEHLDVTKVLCLFMIVLGVVGLELTSDH